jgi:hypothetical protein
VTPSAAAAATAPASWGAPRLASSVSAATCASYNRYNMVVGRRGQEEVSGAPALPGDARSTTMACTRNAPEAHSKIPGLPLGRSTSSAVLPLQRPGQLQTKCSKRTSGRRDMCPKSVVSLGGFWGRLSAGRLKDVGKQRIARCLALGIVNGRVSTSHPSMHGGRQRRRRSMHGAAVSGLLLGGPHQPFPSLP